MYDWAVVGAGPAGIAAVGKLIDHGITNIVWIDPHFKVGDFGTKWRHVPSNTKVERFKKFLHASKAFNYEKIADQFELNRIDPESTCFLGLAADPLQWVSNHLKEKINPIMDLVDSISHANRTWNLHLKNNHAIYAKNIVLAIGAEPKQLLYPTIETIPLHIAMDAEAIKTQLREEDTVALFGSSHSAILVLKNLLENKINKVINFYRSPLRYAVYLKDWILFDDTGLKGPTAEWARENVNGNLPSYVERHYASEENISKFLPQCNKAIYAIGFEKRLLPIQGLEEFDYIEQCGIIAPGLFGVGIAFPEAKYNPLGILEYRVGLWKFMEYLHQVMPIWLNYGT